MGISEGGGRVCYFCTRSLGHFFRTEFLFMTAIVGNIVARSLWLSHKLSPQNASPIAYQRQTLRRLLEKAQYTAFGKHYDFEGILSQELDFMQAFRERVPLHTYNQMHDQWWHRLLEGEENVTWPGRVKFFALSSGTSESSSKHIPVTSDMMKSTKQVAWKQMCALANFHVPKKAYEKGILMLGGTTSLFERGSYYEGDMSGISAKTMPRWMSSFLYKPGQKISKTKEWETRIKLIVRKAREWDVGTVCGVPAWVQIVLERIIAYHKVNHIHEIWPNLSIYIHGGVAFEPYRDAFNKLLGRPIAYSETYMASESSFGFRPAPDRDIQLVLNTGIFFEFVPFDSVNFDENGEPKKKASRNALTIDQVKDGRDYAVVLSTCAGAWRYIIGDVIRFTNAANYEFVIAGRTKQFLSLCGEHMSVDNMTKAVETVQRQLDVEVREFTVAGFAHEGRFAHRWFLGCEGNMPDAMEARRILDETLAQINDDYAVERESALKEVFVEVLPLQVFHDYLKLLGKDGGMAKFPRVMKGEQLARWEAFLSSRIESA